VVAIPAGGVLGQKRAFAQTLAPVKLMRGTAWRVLQESSGEEKLGGEVLVASETTGRPWRPWLLEARKMTVFGRLDARGGFQRSEGRWW
jgi:hypothetical protein